MLSSYAIEELGKSALLLREAARSLKKKLHVAIVKEFRSHHTKLRIIINELIGKRESPNGHTILHKPGLLHDLIEKSRISSPFFRENREDFFNIKNPHLWMFLDGLGDFGSLEREHCIYVDYDSTNHQWRKPTTQHDEIMCERAAKLVLMMVELYDKPLRKLSSFPSDKMKLSDLLKQ
jgi:AbiV family abortive infection protein